MYIYALKMYIRTFRSQKLQAIAGLLTIASQTAKTKMQSSKGFREKKSIDFGFTL